MTDTTRPKARIPTWASLLAVAVAALAVAAPSAEAKKGGTLKTTNQANAPIPDRPTASGPFGALASTITVGNKFKGRRIRDVNVTVQTSGTSGANPAGDLSASLIAPNGAIVPILFAGLGFDAASAPSIGPLTLDDEAPLRLVAGDVPPGVIPNTLTQPWAGSAEPQLGALAVMDDGRVKGTWTLSIIDGTNGETSILSSWGLEVRTGKPYRTK